MKIRAIMVLGILTAAGPVLGAEPYELDPVHSHMEVAVQHFGLVDMICGFQEISGEIQYDAADVTRSSVSVVVKTGSLFSDHLKREEAVKSPGFLDAVKFPEIRFKSKSIQKSDAGLIVTGDLTIRDVTKEVSFPATLLGPIDDPFGGTRMGIMGNLTINRQDYGLTFNRSMKSGQSIVGNDVKISFQVEAVPPAPEESEGSKESKN